jgi:hypothetical protein
MLDHGEEPASLSASAAVALRWRIRGDADAAQLEAECSASLRALAACLEAEGSKPDGLPQERVEAKIDLLLVTLDRLSAAIDARACDARGARFLHCDALFGPVSIEWHEPVPPPDGTHIVIEVRAAPGHPVTACLLATLARHPDALAVTPGVHTPVVEPRVHTPGVEPDAAAVRVLATLAPMTPATREAYERCLFILHRRAVRRAHSKTGTT